MKIRSDRNPRRIGEVIAVTGSLRLKKDAEFKHVIGEMKLQYSTRNDGNFRLAYTGRNENSGEYGTACVVFPPSEMWHFKYKKLESARHGALARAMKVSFGSDNDAAPHIQITVYLENEDDKAGKYMSEALEYAVAEHNAHLTRLRRSSS
ncbi:hypothetical protein SEMRO_1980_G309130.1 [Seminavis robusta]|uniref:Uncharacterized protein n=1 Tax=Seminavis robusta TaxID=568900 RepID=A0A9N8EV96_9STRA|nr:hypothetical protein SEMRO_1980_G309130.1 [Seminavis robusta]|eukprot:Sro1980_g309130.1 n/a (150) ;mRNA; r:6106-6555